MKKKRQHIRPYLPWIFIGIVVVTILTLLVSLFGWRPPKEFSIATGREGGAYYAYAQEYQKRLAELGFTINIRETAGAIETIELLNSGEVDAGFVQNTVSPGIASPSLSTLSAIYYEALWIFYRENLDHPPVNTSQLEGLRINIGEKGSATYETALTILQINDVTAENTTFNNYAFGEAAQKLKDGELDAVMMVTGAASPQITDLLTTPGIQLLPTHRAAAYTSLYKNMAAVVLPHGVVDLDEDIPAQDTPLLAARATLVAGPSLHPDLARLLLIVADEIHRPGGIFEAPNEFPSSTFVGIPMNADAARFLERGPTALEYYLPLWLASRLERFLLLLLPLAIILYSVVRGIPSVTNSVFGYSIKRRYLELREIERNYMDYDEAQLESAIAELEFAQERLIKTTRVPASVLGDLYDLHYHTDVTLDRLYKRRAAFDENL